MAHNEERNVGRLLERLLAQELQTVAIKEIVVVSSGCTDGTERAVNEFAGRDARIRLISECDRRGKSAAINIFLAESRAPFCVVVCADTLPAPDAIERLAAPLADPAAGMTGARVVPLNQKNSFPGYVVHFLWDMHHQVAMRQPKCGELIAFRRVFERMPEDTIVDEPQIEALIREAGLKTVYVPEAVVYNLGPDNLAEIVMRRRSIVAGYIRLARRTDYRTASQRQRWWLLKTIFGHIVRGEEPALHAVGAIAVELVARSLGWWDAKFSRKPLNLWTPAESTKSPADAEMLIK
jgi:poly-beta-1,6-N-acetyl-D-glucosamine synthase